MASTLTTGHRCSIPVIPRGKDNHTIIDPRGESVSMQKRVLLSRVRRKSPIKVYLRYTILERPDRCRYQESIKFFRYQAALPRSDYSGNWNNYTGAL